jgi:hypothetical protein
MRAERRHDLEGGDRRPAFASDRRERRRALDRDERRPPGAIAASERPSTAV